MNFSNYIRASAKENIISRNFFSRQIYTYHFRTSKLRIKTTLLVKQSNEISANWKNQMKLYKLSRKGTFLKEKG